MGIALVHFPEGGFVVGRGRNGMEYSVLLIAVLTVIALMHWPEKKQIVGAVAVLCALAGCAPEPLPDRQAVLETLIEAERAFARASVEQGMRSAFLAYLADASVLFRPMPTDGKAWFEASPEVSGTLAWRPVFADVADTGDFGYTTGPWTYSDSAGTPVSYGQYVSAWRKQADGTWRVEIDTGIGHPQPERPQPEAVATPFDTTTSVALRDLYVEAARVSLLKADRDLAEASEAQGSVAAFGAVLADSVRFYRDGSRPGIGKRAMEDLLAREAGVLTWRSIGAEVSQAGDLGYAYGLATFRAATDTTTTTSTYVRFWKRPPDGAWRIVLDLATLVPRDG